MGSGTIYEHEQTTNERVYNYGQSYSQSHPNASNGQVEEAKDHFRKLITGQYDDLSKEKSSHLSAKDAEALSEAAYKGGNSAPTGYSVVKNYTIKDDGTDAVLFKNDQTGGLVLAYCGSRFTIGDWWTNFVNAFGYRASRYVAAEKIALTVQDQNPGVSITFVGHSLGGGQAALAAAATGLDAITFNASGVNPANYGCQMPAQGQITNYRIVGEPLTTLQTFMPLIPRALGTQKDMWPVTVPTPGNGLNHGIDAVGSALNAYHGSR
jgi:hypothetical protein